MKFIWSEPPRDKETDHFPKSMWELPVLGWLNFNGVWPEKGKEHIEMSYNYVYHFYDIVLYEHCFGENSGHGPKDMAIKQMREYLKSTNLKWQERATYRWTAEKTRKFPNNLPDIVIPSVQIQGVRFMIDAEKTDDDRIKILSEQHAKLQQACDDLGRMLDRFQTKN